MKPKPWTLLFALTLPLLAAPAAAAGAPDRGHGRRVTTVARILPRHAPRRVWTPGHFELVTRRVWVAETTSRVWIEPVYATRYDSCANPYRVQVRAGFWSVRTVPGRYELRRERLWRPGCWTVVSYAQGR